LIVVVLSFGASRGTWSQEVDPSDDSAFARSGFRFSLAPGIAVPFGDWTGDSISRSSTFGLRLGGEIIRGNLGITPAFRLDYVQWANDFDVSLHLLHFGLECRGALHRGRLVPYVSLGLGGDYQANTDVPASQSGFGLGLNVALGTDFLLTPRFAIGAALTIHPGFAPSSSVDGAPDVRYVAISFAIASY